MALKLISTLLPNNYRTEGNASRSGDIYLYNGSRVGDKLPSWRKVIHSGHQATTAMTLNALKVKKVKPMSLTFNLRFYWGFGSSDYSEYPQVQRFGYLPDFRSHAVTHASTVTEADEAEALARLYQRIRKEHYGVNGLLFLGELRETIHMLRNPLESARQETLKFLKTLKSKRREVQTKVKRRKGESGQSHARRQLDAVKNGVAGTWLEYVFGVLPAISDCKDIVEEIQRQVQNVPKKARVRARSKTTPVEQSVWTVDTNYTEYEKQLGLRKHTTNASCQYIAGFKTSVTLPTSSIEKSMDGFGFQLENFIPTLYELMPWSFLIDYFVNLGDILEAACTVTSDVAWVCKTVRQVTRIWEWNSLEPFGSGGFQKYQVLNVDGERESIRDLVYTTYTRTPLSSIPLPPLVASIPGLDSRKWFNMAALLAQARDFRFKH